MDVLFFHDDGINPLQKYILDRNLFLLLRLYLNLLFLNNRRCASENTGYKARLFETLGTLIFIIIIFLNAFNLYQLSNNKYENAYQNSIRDYLTQLYNRRYFYLVLIKKCNGSLCKTIV